MLRSVTEADIEDYHFPLPGFRFHPTDEELVDFYLRRKVQKKAIGIELIKPIDIYKHNPWDLPNAGNNLGDKEWYFFCKRARKYKNSVRPNRVTSSGFWKATGIDKAIYSQAGKNHSHCIGLKKTLVYYKGTAGRGSSKTEWMMHEFRLPSHTQSHNTSHSSFFAKFTDNNNPQEAEIWTLCRIFKRIAPSTKYAPNWREVSGGAKGDSIFGEMNKSNLYNTDFMDQCYDRERSTYISFSSSFMSCNDEMKAVVANQGKGKPNPLMMNFSSIIPETTSSFTDESPLSTSSLSNFEGDATDFFGYEEDRNMFELVADDE